MDNTSYINIYVVDHTKINNLDFKLDYIYYEKTSFYFMYSYIDKINNYDSDFIYQGM